MAKTVAIVAAQWNELVVNALVEGAVDTLQSSGYESVVIRVPGTWEIPLVAQKALQNHEGVVALGCILQGATTHAALLAGDVSSALMKLQMESGKPISWGILTPETQEQAFERAGMKLGNKGREAAGALVDSLRVIDSLS